MDRLGLGYGQLRDTYPRLIYCSITGFGQNGPRAQFAGHDLNYMAISGLLSLTCGSDGGPTLPHAPIADIAGGSYPAFSNVLLALIERERTGHGCHLDISMAENLLTLAYWGLAQGHAAGLWPQPGSGLITGGSPRYQVYACADGGHVAAAPIEERFWERFCDLLALDPDLRALDNDAKVVTRAVAQIIGARSSSYWQSIFDTEDVCCCVIHSLEQAVQDPHFQARGLFARRVCTDAGSTMPALPVPVASRFCTPEIERCAPPLGSEPLEATGGNPG
jgi:crotonobetainyl-CoA:carnitine CoA-transferase CaiB-like acyl-CoA transferase